MEASIRHDILLSGYYGMGNLGDEAILEAIVQHLRELVPGIRIAVLSGPHSDIPKQLGLHSYDRWSSKEIDVAIRRSSVVCSGGGSLLQDITDDITVPYYLSIVEQALSLSKQVVIYAQGLGPLNKSMSREAVAKVLPRAACVTFRDQSSGELYERLCTTSSYQIACDPVFGLDVRVTSRARTSIEMIHEEANGRPIVGLSLKDWTRVDEHTWIRTLRRIQQEFEAFYVAIPFHSRFDRDLTCLIRDSLSPNGIRMLEGGMLPSEWIEVIRHFDMMMGVRYHSLVLATNAGVPSIGFSYDPKVASLTELLGEEGLMIRDELNDTLIDDFSALFNDRKEVQKSLISRGGLLSELSRTPAYLTAQVLHQAQATG